MKRWFFIWGFTCGILLMAFLPAETPQHAVPTKEEPKYPPLEVLCDGEGAFTFSDEDGGLMHEAFRNYAEASANLAKYKMAKAARDRGEIDGRFKFIPPGQLKVCPAPEPSPSPSPIPSPTPSSYEMVWPKGLTVDDLIIHDWRSSDVFRAIGILVQAESPAHITDVPIISITMPCGSHWELCPGDTIPIVDVPCYCGNPNHWFFKVRE
jgi:hypothetical protein